MMKHINNLSPLKSETDVPLIGSLDLDGKILPKSVSGEIYYKHMSRTKNVKIRTELSAFVNMVINLRVP
jgi:hypothetical protein